MSPVKKKFVLTHTVKNIFSLKENESNFSEEEEHYGVPWKMRVSHYPGFLGFHLFCNYPKNKGTWSIRVNFEMKLTPKTGKSTTVTATGDFSNDSEFTGWGRNDFRKWEEIMNDSLIDDVFFIEVHAKIIEMTGIEQKKLRNFDESVKQFSDVVLIVNDEKFYVSKLYLASQSSYFEALFSKNFEESNKSEITLNEIDAEDFQKFLECIYCENSVNDDTVEGILQLADMYDAKVAIQRCVEFLKKESKLTLTDKLRLAFQYKLDVFKMDCISKINTVADIRSVTSNGLDEMDLSAVKFLLTKSLELHK